MQDMHTLANRVLLSELKAGGLVQGDVEEALAADMGALFMPHGAHAWCLLQECQSGYERSRAGSGPFRSHNSRGWVWLCFRSALDT